MHKPVITLSTILFHPVMQNMTWPHTFDLDHIKCARVTRVLSCKHGTHEGTFNNIKPSSRADSLKESLQLLHPAKLVYQTVSHTNLGFLDFVFLDNEFPGRLPRAFFMALGVGTRYTGSIVDTYTDTHTPTQQSYFFVPPTIVPDQLWILD